MAEPQAHKSSQLELTIHLIAPPEVFTFSTQRSLQPALSELLSSEMDSEKNGVHSSRNKCCAKGETSKLIKKKKIPALYLSKVF